MTAQVQAELAREQERDKLERRLARDVGKAVAEFGMLDQGDRVMVAISGGKDSYTLLHLLRKLQRVAPIDFEIVAVNVDQGQPGFPVDTLRAWLEREGYAHRIVVEDTYSIVKEKVPEGKTYCSLCSRLRRGILYNVAQGLGCTKIALGHHRDDALHTLMLNLFFAGQLKSMPPKLQSDDGRNVVIRPLIYAREEEIARFAALEAFPILPCNLCGSQENLQRKQMRTLLEDLEAKNPGTKTSMLAALRNVRPTHLLDHGLWRKLGLPLAPGEAPPEEASAETGEGPVIGVERLSR
jgi:tRNA 2-thiocytidine biosynthesis protein TtcA